MSALRIPALLSGLLVAALSAAGQAAPATKPQAADDGTGLMQRATNAMMKSSQAVTQAMRNEALRIRDFFDVQLPGALGQHNLVFDFEPKVGDLVRREFVRFPMELRYGVAANWEAYAGITPVTPNPIDSGEDCRWSMGMARVGVRHDMIFKNLILPQLSAGLETYVPLGEPPVDLIDHYVHVRPFLTASRPLEFLPGTDLFVALSYDRTVSCPARDNVPSRVVRRHIVEIAPGLLYKPNEWGAFVQYALRYQEEPVGNRLVHLAKVGVIYDMPLEQSQRWGLPGKWRFELGYKMTDEEGLTLDHGIHARVKWRTDLLGHKRKSD